MARAATTIGVLVAGLWLATSALMPTVAAETDPAAPEARRATLEQAARAWERGDAAAFARAFAPQGELVVPRQRWVGPEAIRQAFEAFAQDNGDVRIRIRRLLLDGDAAAIEWDWSHRVRATGERYRAQDAILVDFQGGKIARWREYIDSESAS